MMPDHSNATVTISFAGLALFCVNKSKQNRREVGIIHCDRHRSIMDIQKIVLDDSGAPCKSILNKDFPPFFDSDILIKVVNPNPRPLDERTRIFSEGPVFDRVDGIGNENDFRWIVDLEGEELHDEKLELIRTPSTGGAARISPKIFINEGVLYTEMKTEERLALIQNGNAGDEFGEVGLKIGVDLFVGDGGCVQLWNKRGADRTLLTTLEKSANTKYHISVENLCTVEGEHGGTDFSLFYDVLQDSRGRRFDFRRIVENLGQGDPNNFLRTNPLFSLDNNPLICLDGFLGITQTIAEDEFDM